MAPDANDARPSSEEQSTPAPYDFSNFADIHRCVTAEPEEKLKREVASYIETLQARNQLASYQIVFLWDDDLISDYHADQIYRAVSRNPKEKDILLVINSPGGRIEPAYLISKASKQCSARKFSVAVPRRAKSAATLIALGADEIHMGLMSQLGPIDPQIGGYPALALGNALDVLAKLTAQVPDSAKMFSEYLKGKLELTDLGLFERVSESAAQYAERLLKNKTLPEGSSPVSVAKLFVYHYKDHGFVIDVDEAVAHLGKAVVRSKTPEYDFANAVFEFFDNLKFMLQYQRKRRFWYVGSLGDGLTITNLKANS